MLIGEGPGKDEEIEGVPFVGNSGEVLEAILEKLNMTEMVYLTNTVLCRSCGEATDATGNVLYKTDRNTGEVRTRRDGTPIPLIRDMPPLPVQMEACRPRLEEEIYLVDPIIIVTMGGKATEALLKRSVTITKLRGSPQTLEITGALPIPKLTEKKKVWARRVKGKVSLPLVQNTVKYLCIPTVHPSWVARHLADQGKDSPFRQFHADLEKAKKVYLRYQEEKDALQREAS